jgi:hypothetical protein
MKSILLALPFVVVACSAPPATPEDVASLSQAIDPTHNPPTTIPLSKFEVIPALPPPVAFPTLKTGVFNIAPFLPGYNARLPTLIWGLKKAGISVAPAYLPCNPAFQYNEDLCYEDYGLTVSECDSSEKVNAQDCANALNICQTSTCNNDYQQCLEGIPPCNDYTCVSTEDDEFNRCAQNANLCMVQIESSGFCGNNFTICLGSVQTENGNCRTVAQYNYQNCSNKIGLCI